MTATRPKNRARIRAKPAWRRFDARFRDHRRHYLVQTAMATASMLIVLLLLDLVEQTVLIASLGASTFIAFAMPHDRRSGPRYLIGGYLVGALAGCSMSLAAGWLLAIATVDPRIVQVCCAAVALGLAFLVMVVIDTEHPPAAALALGFVLNDWDPVTLGVVMSGIALIAAIKEALKPRLLDLI